MALHHAGTRLSEAVRRQRPTFGRTDSRLPDRTGRALANCATLCGAQPVVCRPRCPRSGLAVVESAGVAKGVSVRPRALLTDMLVRLVLKQLLGPNELAWVRQLGMRIPLGVLWRLPNERDSNSL